MTQYSLSLGLATVAVSLWPMEILACDCTSDNGLWAERRCKQFVPPFRSMIIFMSTWITGLIYIALKLLAIIFIMSQRDFIKPLKLLHSYLNSTVYICMPYVAYVSFLQRKYSAWGKGTVGRGNRYAKNICVGEYCYSLYILPS